MNRYVNIHLMTDKPNMYGILPANVRYSEGLSSFAKLMYTEISALSNKHGYCFATNSYFGKVFNKSSASISRALTELKDCGAITIIDGEGGELVRKITPCSPTKKLKMITPHLIENDNPTLIKNEEHNNTSYNNTSLSNTKVLDIKVNPLLAKTKLLSVIRFYSEVWRSRYGTSPTVNIPRAGKSLKPILDSLGEYKIFLLIMQFFNWRGATGEDDFLHKRLLSSAFPLYWIPDHADAMLAFMRNVTKINVDDELEVKKIVDAKLKELGLSAVL
jgi:hypothetical protein